MANQSGRVLAIGLDCAEPSLLLERWRANLPNLNRLMSTGPYGRLEGFHPAITVPAWASVLASRDPGQLGDYGFRNRANIGRLRGGAMGAGFLGELIGVPLALQGIAALSSLCTVVARRLRPEALTEGLPRMVVSVATD